MHTQQRTPYLDTALAVMHGALFERTEDPNPLNHPDPDDVPMPPDDPARKAPIDEPPKPSIPKRV
jgi:hypothetical protein